MCAREPARCWPVISAILGIISRCFSAPRLPLRGSPTSRQADRDLDYFLLFAPDGVLEQDAVALGSFPQLNARKRSPSMIFVRTPSISGGIANRSLPVST